MNTRLTPLGGVLYGLAAYAMWGAVPLYFAELKSLPPLELLAHRVAWSVPLMALVVTAAGRWGDVGRLLRDRATRRRLVLSTALISVNWFTFLYGVVSGQVMQTSLGYFLAPLLNVALGVLAFGERLRPAQWAAVGLALSGVAVFAARVGGLPWISLTLALSFSLYGMVRKRANVDGVLGFTVETYFLAPVALAYLGWLTARGQMVLTGGDVYLNVLVPLAGVVTAGPLICYAQAVRRLKYSSLGFIQYLSPTLTFLLAVFWFREPFDPARQLTFALIWVGVAVFLIDAAVFIRRRSRGSPSEVAPP